MKTKRFMITISTRPSVGVELSDLKKSPSDLVYRVAYNCVRLDRCGRIFFRRFIGLRRPSWQGIFSQKISKGAKIGTRQLNRYNKKYRAVPSTAPHASYPL